MDGIFAQVHRAVSACLTGFAAPAVVPTLPTAAADLNGVVLFPLLGGVVLTVLTLLVSAASTSTWQLAAGCCPDGLAAGLSAAVVLVPRPPPRRPRRPHQQRMQRRPTRCLRRHVHPPAAPCLQPLPYWPPVTEPPYRRPVGSAGPERRSLVPRRPLSFLPPGRAAPAVPW
ncbi:hypothetical protein KCH_34180 [Kitasatospora cheerisanensis KCTC 2395]|uniref:Uncharacterized protein n=1 Tax=Kitasatospora cheerisanensis KCTC 2395 TaxID=1348663 RepID=A0A066Z3F4_9ACTN|nr:hypothetical protein KCH_34180 [Kitasatospora cheerisanensis KCTC 2395]